MENKLLESWLAIATRDLCPAAKERIALEITAHFEEAVAAHVAEGLPLLEAELRARDELGEAEAAGKRFRKKHLTRRDVAEIRRWTGDNPQWSLPPRVAGTLVCLLVAALLVYPRDAGMCTLIWLAFPEMWSFAMIKQKVNSPQKLFKRALTIQIFFGFLTAYWMVLGEKTFWIYFFYVFLILTTISWHRLWQKVKNDQFKWN